MKKNIVLIGFMGTGKTVVGRALAGKLGLSFIDTDEEIEKSSGKTIAEIFESHGVERFRVLERLVIKGISNMEGLVVATGGGAVLNPDNVTALKNKGIIVLLRSSPEEIYRRIEQENSRPLLAGGGDRLRRIKDLMQQREVAYKESADLEIINDDSKEQVAAKIIQLLKERDHI